MYHAHDHSLDLNRLLETLLDEQRLEPGDTLKVLEQARNTALHPLELLANLNLTDRQRPDCILDLDTLCQWLADKTGQVYRRLDPLKIDLARVNGLISPAFARCHGIMAVARDERGVTVASAQPYQRGWEADLARSLGLPIRRVLANPVQLRQLTHTCEHLAQSIQGAQRQGASLGALEHLLEQGASACSDTVDDAHIVHIADWLVAYAVEQRASDIHLEPRQDQGRLRYRIDGLLHTVYGFPASVTLALVSRLKHLARMDVAQKRRPQDGRLRSRLAGGKEVELRLSTLPTPFGEKLVLRLFDPEQLHESFERLGLDGALLAQWHALLSRRQGIILLTGPTGSGKTSTLYASLKHLATPEVNLCTIEDPIERLEPGFNQLQVQPSLDLTFANGVRALLRQDPDIIMIGEIRDRETAQVAVQAALTGHLVLSTLHTNDACAAVTRLQELGVADYLIKATLVAVMAQRLIRTFCTDCRGQLHNADGSCRTCRGTGYLGRTGLFELLVLCEALRARIATRTDLDSFRHQALAHGMRDLRRCGEEKVAQGLTSLQEVFRVCG
ncbi:type II/IV secretion system protein [Pseudomonas sp. S75]|uniref:GspE/PulE family protein n=1 Tax=unclassified Pseudomonas TaxID=196821 RepID=UPI00190307B0|nr:MULTISPECIES: GspE/PulE family protein [unclassified Pseudomonas]MBJ9978000.1 type II/IV secretion system protein [Pseudomonas sp. S30]MBK0155710.1 type II/IV secretion system protein [Pseudomonas sp. S75]